MNATHPLCMILALMCALGTLQLDPGISRGRVLVMS
jgi:hypothetical protein